MCSDCAQSRTTRHFSNRPDREWKQPYMKNARNRALFEKILVGARGFEPAFANATAWQTSDPSVPNRALTRRFPNVFVVSWTRVATG